MQNAKIVFYEITWFDLKKRVNLIALRYFKNMKGRCGFYGVISFSMKKKMYTWSNIMNYSSVILMVLVFLN